MYSYEYYPDEDILHVFWGPVLIAEFNQKGLDIFKVKKDKFVNGLHIIPAEDKFAITHRVTECLAEPEPIVSTVCNCEFCRSQRR